jgi:transcriptional regulator GlxA family with amidase domain
MKIRVGILIFDEVEIMDFAGPSEVFASAKIGNNPCFEVITFGMTSFPTFVHGGIEVIPNLTIQSKIPLDIVIIPGGDGVNEIINNPDLRDWLDYAKQQGAQLASICTGAFILASFGYLDGLQATTHHEDLDELKQRYPDINVVKGVRFVDEGQILSAAGVSAGVDLSLYLVEKHCGETVAAACRKRMEWRF